ncbi:hypothetical protein E2C01_043094 [Portunus trituberculatus]|uniref:Secreted protein n=1 Tax=Portunus trituberculatus TaxID=210409 RepID=A0A5B7FUR4_PORTR|nr:hypothetical protein [Portunus trituberculatus]
MAVVCVVCTVFAWSRAEVFLVWGIVSLNNRDATTTKTTITTTTTATTTTTINVSSPYLELLRHMPFCFPKGIEF